jgi:Acetyl-CoA dehydrogenase C-terminal like
MCTCTFSVEAANRSVVNHADKVFYEAKLTTPRFYVDTMIPEAIAAADTIVNGADGTMALEEAAF